MNLHDGGGGGEPYQKATHTGRVNSCRLKKKMDYKECLSVVQNIKMTTVLGLYVVTTEKNLQSYEVV